MGESQGKETSANKSLRLTINATDGDVTQTLQNRSVQDAIKNSVEEAVDQKIVEETVNDGRLPSDEELEDAVKQEIKRIWDVLFGAKRHKRIHVEGQGFS